MDEILDLRDRMIGSAFAKAKRAYETFFSGSGYGDQRKGSAIRPGRPGGASPNENLPQYDQAIADFMSSSPDG
jgi:hypothetical protein